MNKIILHIFNLNKINNRQNNNILINLILEYIGMESSFLTK